MGDLDPDPAPNPVPDPPQKGNPEVVPGPNQNGTVVAVQNREDKIRATGASETGGQIVPSGFLKNRKADRNNLFLFVLPSPQFLDLPPPLQNEDFFFLVRFFIILSTNFMLLVHKIIGIFCYCFSPTTSKPHLFCHIYKFLCRSYILKNKKQE